MQKLANWTYRHPNTAFSLVFFALTLSYSIVHCLLYLDVFAGIPISFEESLIWSVKKFGFWWLAAPFFPPLVAYLWKINKGLPAAVFLIAIVASTSVSLYLDYLHLGANNRLLRNLITFLPTQFANAVCVLLGCVLCYRFNEHRSPSTEQHVAQVQASPDTESLSVLHGNRNVELPLNRIEAISAGGNYMEVFGGDRTYLLRSTMKQLEEKLAGYGFLRIHRSHLVNGAAVRLTNHGKVVTLSNGQQLPIGHKYRKNIVNIQ